MFPEFVKRRHPTKEGREKLAARLGLTIGPYSQDWEWEIADRRCFQNWLTAYQKEPLTDDERFSLMEMLIQCVEDIAALDFPNQGVEQIPEWQAVPALLRTNPELHESNICYWSFLEEELPETDAFRVAAPMRRVWADVRPLLHGSRSTFG